MTQKLKRRDFINKSARLGSLSFIGSHIVSSLKADGLFASSPQAIPDVIAVHGDDYMKSTLKAIELLGGMSKFVPKNARVAILPNTQSRNPGAFTKPEIVRATIRLAREAGAGEINCLSWLPAKYWEATGLGKVVAEEGAHLRIADSKDESLFRSVSIPGGKVLKETKLIKLLSEHDVFINVPIMKDHVGNKFTGTMKNLMGLNFPGVNKFFHTGDKDKPDDIEHLDQCIADLNTVCRPALCIVDATEFITTNGPFGPGQLMSPKKVVAGIDRIAIDSYCTSLLGMKGEDIIMIKRGFEHGLGEINLKKVKIQETGV